MDALDRTGSANISRSAAIAVACGVAWLTYMMVAGWGGLEDDGFIHLEYAKNLYAGKGFAYQGRVSYGNSAPLWAVLLAVSHFAISDWLWTTKVVSLAGLVACLSGAWVLGASAARHLGLKRSVAAWLVALVALQPYTTIQAFSGMEAVGALAVALWFTWLALLADLRGRLWWVLAVLAGLAPLVRGELVILSFFGSLYAAWRLWRDDGRAALWRIVLGAAIAALPALLWAWYAMAHFGRIVPNTNSAKRLVGFEHVGLRSGILRTAQILLLGYGVECAIVSVAGLILLWRLVSHRCWTAAVGRWGVAVGMTLWPVALTIFYLANRTAVQTRYVLIAGPFLTLVAMLVAFRCMQGATARRRGVGMVAMAAMLLGTVFVSAFCAGPKVINRAKGVAAMSDFFAVVRQQTPPDAPLAIYSIGQVVHEVPNPIIDIGGLVMPEGQRYLTDSAAMLRWAKSQGARYFVQNLDEPLDRTGLEVVHRAKFPVRGWRFSLRATDGYATMGLLRLVEPDRATP